jgi:hypothetical protein
MPSGSGPRSFGRLASKAAPKPPSRPGKWSSMKDAAKATPPPLSTTPSAPASPSRPETGRPSAAPNAGSDSVVGVGDTVLHAKFGKGKVLALEGSAPNEKATVFFPSVGQKQLLLKFAKLEVVG